MLLVLIWLYPSVYVAFILYNGVIKSQRNCFTLWRNIVWCICKAYDKNPTVNIKILHVNLTTAEGKGRGNKEGDRGEAEDIARCAEWNTIKGKRKRGVCNNNKKETLGRWFFHAKVRMAETHSRCVSKLLVITFTIIGHKHLKLTMLMDALHQYSTHCFSWESRSIIYIHLHF